MIFNPLLTVMSLNNGLSISVAMDRFPEKIYVAVFISAIMPSPTNTVLDIQKENVGRQAKAGIQGTSSRFEISQVKGCTQAIPTPEKLVEQYQKSPPEDLTLATKLVRPSRVFGKPDLLKETKVSVEKYGSVRRVFVLGDEVDYVKDLLKCTIAKYPPDEVKEIPGSDHMVMLSKPQELCTYLQEIALRYS